MALYTLIESGRRGLLPTHAPLRTVRESFPSYGSSLSNPALGVALSGQRPLRYSPLAAETNFRSPRTHRLIAQPSFAFPLGSLVPLAFLHRETRPTWPYPAHYTPALAFSVLSMLLLLTRLAVRSARRDPGEPRSFSMFHNNHPGMI